MSYILSPLSIVLGHSFLRRELIVGCHLNLIRRMLPVPLLSNDRLCGIEPKLHRMCILS
jgi:hypothetical protein